MNLSKKELIVAGITPYFLEKGGFWFTQHEKELKESWTTSPFFQENLLLLEQGETRSLSQLLRKLDELGYEKVFTVQDPGEFSSQGGTVEVFPINEAHAFRIEFVGNAIESVEQLAVSVKDQDTARKALQKRLSSQKRFSDLANLAEGEYLVHLDHGVGTFSGKQDVQGISYYILEYAASDKLLIPEGLERKLSRYIGFQEPRISRLGSILWQKTKKKTKEDVEKLAKKLLSLYANRETATRPPYLEKTEISTSLQDTFSYQETPDQLQTLQDIEKDLTQSEKPMDRIVVGDVGFGKTEIALRSMVRAVEQGYQAMLLAPTTLLCYQHWQTFVERLQTLPVRVVLLSRLQSLKEQADILQKLKAGTYDIVIGTHRLLSQDVVFKNLGMLVIDDEQKFGVKQKEKLKERTANVDILSLSATPIPRTLSMSLSSLKDMSAIQTPPAGRIPVEITVSIKNEGIIKTAIEQELKRNGQVYYLHNRVGTIERTADYIRKLIPGIRVETAHAQLPESRLISIIEDFRNKKFNVLVATTIIENGLDLPEVNSIIVEDTAKLGLSQAYQIRGRIGRSFQKAYAWLLHGKTLTDKAKERLRALEEATDPGSGYKVALKDLEMRGAGNILGKEQTGTINAVGLNLYCQMLSDAIEKQKQGMVQYNHL